MIAAGVVLVVGVVAGYVRRRARRRREAVAYRLAQQMDERACQATLRPRTGDVVATGQRNGHLL